MINKIASQISISAKKFVGKTSNFSTNNPIAKKPLEFDIFVKSPKESDSLDLFDKVVYFIEDLKIRKAKKEYQKIDFVPAKTLQEAHKFASDIGVEEVTLGESDTLEVLNYINEGFVGFKNAHLGLAEIPRRVRFIEDDEKTLMSANATFRTFNINKNIFGINQIDSQIQKRLDDVIDSFCDVTNDGVEIPGFYGTEKEIAYAQNLINLFRNDKNSLNYGQKVELLSILSHMKFNVSLFAYRPKEFAQKLFARPDILQNSSPFQKQELLERITNAPTDFDALMEFSRILRDYQENFKIRTSNEKFSSLFHEMGHLQDYYQDRVSASGMFKSSEFYPEELKKWLDDKEKQKIAFSVSAYATTGPGEFIAETYSKLLSGDSVSKEAIELYKRMNGPKIPDII
ncbi:MAG: hypothetical protein IJB79_04210 [Candidatus Gastranaerophilales bacterium]|nr:hypothetical protein [Candidatus Gastranaerophilales bacterium]